MEETLVSFQVAKLAKEKGFGLGKKDYCQLPYYYNLKGNLNDMKDNLFKRDISTTHLGALTLDNVEVGISFMDNSLDECILAPTQSLLQKWLRKVHNIDITIMIRFADTYSYIIHKNRVLQKDFYKLIIIAKPLL